MSELTECSHVSQEFRQAINLIVELDPVPGITPLIRMIESLGIAICSQADVYSSVSWRDIFSFDTLISIYINIGFYFTYLLLLCQGGARIINVIWYTTVLWKTLCWHISIHLQIK